LFANETPSLPFLRFLEDLPVHVSQGGVNRDPARSERL
jgi:hypothetical protein